MSVVLWEGEITGSKGPRAMSLDSSEEKINYDCNGYVFGCSCFFVVFFFLIATLFISIFLSYKLVRA